MGSPFKDARLRTGHHRATYTAPSPEHVCTFASEPDQVSDARNWAQSLKFEQLTMAICTSSHVPVTSLILSVAGTTILAAQILPT